MFTQLHTKVIVSEGKPLFQLTLGTKPFEKATILEFEFPLMNTTVLKEMIEGNDAEDQNDDGFFIRMEDETVSIKIYRESDSSESKSVDITLPFVVCKQAFLDLLPLYEAEDRRPEEDGSDEDELGKIPDEKIRKMDKINMTKKEYEEKYYYGGFEREAEIKSGKNLHCAFCEGEYVANNLYVIQNRQTGEEKIVCHYCCDEMEKDWMLLPIWTWEEIQKRA